MAMHYKEVPFRNPFVLMIWRGSFITEECEGCLTVLLTRNSEFFSHLGMIVKSYLFHFLSLGKDLFYDFVFDFQ